MLAAAVCRQLHVFYYYFLYVTSVIIKYYVTPDHADAPSFFMLWHFSTVAWCLAGVNQSGASNCQLCSATVRLFCPTPPRIKNKYTSRVYILNTSCFCLHLLSCFACSFILTWARIHGATRHMLWTCAWI